LPANGRNRGRLLLTGFTLWWPATIWDVPMSETKEQTPDQPARLRSTWSDFRLSRPGLSGDWLAKLWRRLVTAVSVVLGLLVSLYTAAVMLDGHPATGMVAAVILVVFSAISVLVHEIGHAAAAWAVGWRVHLIVVGPLAFAPRRGRFIRISNRRDRPDLGGWVNATPPPESSWKNGDIPFILGGAIGNLLLAVISVLAALAIHETERHIFTGLMGLAALSVVFALANLAPVCGPGGRKNDGALLVEAVKGEEPPVRDRKIARLIGMVYDGIPAVEWDESALNELADEPSINRDDVDRLLVSYALAVADLAALKLILKRYLEAKPEAPAEYRCLYAFAIAMIDRDAPHAAEILEKVPGKAAKKSFSFWRAQAATAHLLGRRDEALAAIRNARHAAGKLGARPDDDDEAVFRAIEQGRDLPRLAPRRRLSAGMIGPRAAERRAGSGSSAADL